MIQLEPMPALERRWIHLALRDHPQVATQSIGEEPNRRIVVLSARRLKPDSSWARHARRSPIVTIPPTNPRPTAPHRMACVT